jgi:demethylmenaquinone methyltransferase/2-methoxy-6-polyprenyl-1,4-benzoquinol methylase
MFDAIAPRYDLLNRLLSLGRDRAWRRITADRIVSTAPHGPIADLATGTGDLLIELRKATRATSRSRLICGVDFAAGMLRVALEKAPGGDSLGQCLICADGRALPFNDGSLAAVTIAFGLRNYPGLEEGILEMKRVLVPGGIVGILEFTRDRSWWMDVLFRPYARRVIPSIGKLLSRDPLAYEYLPKSVEAFATSSQMWGALQRAGLEAVEERSFTGGICRLFMARNRG